MFEEDAKDMETRGLWDLMVEVEDERLSELRLFADGHMRRVVHILSVELLTTRPKLKGNLAGGPALANVWSAGTGALGVTGLWLVSTWRFPWRWRKRRRRKKVVEPAKMMIVRIQARALVA